MKEKTKTGLEILGAAAVIGVVGNILLRQTPWGLNAFLFVGMFTAALLALMYRRRPELLTMTNISLAAAMVFFASMFLIRDSMELRVYDTIAILVLMGVFLLSSFGLKAHISGVFHYASGFVWSGITSAFGSFALLGADIDWKDIPGNNISKNLFSILRGVAIALPLILIFGALFMAADAAYEGMINRVLNFDMEIVVSHVLITSALAWLTAGYFRGAMITPTAAAAESVRSAFSILAEPSADASESKPPETSFVHKMAEENIEPEKALPNDATILEHINLTDDGTPTPSSASASEPTEPPSADAANNAAERDWQDLDNAKFPSVFTFGTIETVIILGLVDLLFVSFVAVQLPYLFGGMDLVQNTPDFKLADYARRGFGELVAVAALVLPMLLITHWLIRKEELRAQLLYKILAGAQIVLLFVVMASAVQRLVLLTGELGYGLTTVRFYPMVLMTWLAVVFVWFAVTVFRGARNHFAWGALWAAIIILAGTNLMNPDGFIVRTNLQLMQQGREFDPTYNASLSDDALPILVASFDKLKSEDALKAYQRLQRRACEKVREGSDIRSWNRSRIETTNIIRTYAIQPLEASKCLPLD